VHLVALAEEQLGQVAAVLPRDPGDQCPLRHHLTVLPALDRQEQR
jgi:hypothetical protein